MKKSNIVRTLLVVMAIYSPSMAAIYSPSTKFNAAAPDIHAFKPTEIVFPEFLEPDLTPRSEGYSGFSGFVQEIRNAVRSSGGAPRRNRTRGTSPAGNTAARQTADTNHESSIKIKLGPNSGTGDTAEVYLGVSLKQVLNEIPSPDSISGDRPAKSAGNNSPNKNKVSAGSAGGGSLGGGSWFRGGLLSTGNSGWSLGFGFDMTPLNYPTDLGNGPYISPQSSDEEVSKSLKALRRMVIDLVFNPYVYFSLLIISILMFMARIRGPSS